MVNSVGEYVAGESYEISDEIADRFVILGYAEGELSREYNAEERDAFQRDVQKVGI